MIHVSPAIRLMNGSLLSIFSFSTGTSIVSPRNSAVNFSCVHCAVMLCPCVDTKSSVMVMVGFKMASPPADCDSHEWTQVLPQFLVQFLIQFQALSQVL